MVHLMSIETNYVIMFTGCLIAATVNTLNRKGAQKRKKKTDVQNLFTRQLLDSMEAERKRIATELHDSLGQELLIIKNRILLTLKNLKDKNYVKEQLDEISETVTRAIQETRDISYNLRPYQIDRLGLTKALESIVNRSAQATAIKFTFDIDPIDNVVPKEMGIHIFRIIQESVNNIIKHSNATTGKVIVKRWHNRVNLDVVDNGTGFHVTKEKFEGPKGLGLNGIIERARLIDGTIRIESHPGKGTRILLTIKTS
jgi:signal transduction histidine kinase